MKKREAAIISAYTGILLGDFGEVRDYIDELYQRKGCQIKSRIYSDAWGEEVKEASKGDFLKIHESLKETK
jgi:archaellum biogenesis protein FlaJ (TadC family)